MEIYIGQQLLDLGAAMLLGIVCSMTYDLLRPIRLRRRNNKPLTHTVDIIFVLVVLLAVFLFALRIGQGEFRLFMLCGFLVGGVLYFLLLSPLLRPLWDFWAEAIAGFLALLWKPVALLGCAAKKIGTTAKKYFHFIRKYATIKRYKWEFIHTRRQITGEGGRLHHEKRKKSREKP